MPRIPADRLVAHLTALFAAERVPKARARRLAELFTQASADGVWSHGVHRVPGLLRLLRDGMIADTQSDPRLIATFGALQRYDGLSGLGALNAEFCIDRAIELADTHGVGCVALRNTRHWGRAGNCGWRAAERGFLAICWTNTPPNMPAWGDTGGTPSVGNNPIVLAAPGQAGEHLVLDMALSQFSFGRLETYRAENRPLPVPGGTDASGAPTTDAAAILNGGLPWPIGFWKGSGMAILLDAFAAILSDGSATHSLTPGGDDAGASQVFLAFQPNRLGGRAASERTQEIIHHFATASPQSRYPGQAALAHRRHSELEGVFVRDDIWRELS
jgi:3-dehydro-L-gulonate 2-dehydrogenase